MAAKPRRSEDRNYTPEPERPEGDLPEEAVPPPTIRPEDKKDEGDPTLTGHLDIGAEDPGVDLNTEQQK